MYCVSLDCVSFHLAGSRRVLSSLLSLFRRQLGHLSPADDHRMHNRRRVRVPTIAPTNICQMSPWRVQLSQPYNTEVLCRKKAGIRLGRSVFEADITTTTGQQPFRRNRKRDGDCSKPSSRDAVDWFILSSRG